MEEKVKKDVIYIDVEDEITDVVNKIKSSNEKIIALVPPKGIGLLRSAVNIRILARTSKKGGKQLVLVSNNEALRAMSASAGIPVAKTLQSKPEIPEIDALEVDDEDIIDGEKLPVSDFAGKTKDEEEAEMLENIDIDDNKNFSKKEPEVAKESHRKSSSAKAVPDFNKFRKKVFIFGGLGVVVVAFFVWAIFFAPAAKVIISAKTSNVNISETLSLTSNESNRNIEKGILAVKTETIEKNAEVSFEVTGTKEEGEAASGVLTLSQGTESDPVTVKSGTAFSAGSCNFVSVETAVIPGAKFSGGALSRNGSTSVKIRATQIGDQCNLAPQKYTHNVSGVTASGGQLSGGSKTVKKVVSEKDVAAAKAKLSDVNSETVKNELISKISSDYTVIADSFSAQIGEPEVSPAVNAEATDGKAVLKAKSIYTIKAISKNDLSEYLKFAVKSKIQGEEKKIYDNGEKNQTLSGFVDGETSSIKFSTTAKVGPVINENDIKEKIKGKRFSDVQSTIEKIDGVNNVNVEFSYFWVREIPTNVDKIKIDFTVQE